MVKVRTTRDHGDTEWTLRLLVDALYNEIQAKRALIATLKKWRSDHPLVKLHPPCLHPIWVKRSSLLAIVTITTNCAYTAMDNILIMSAR